MTDKKAGDSQEGQLDKRPEQKLKAPDAIEAINAGGAQIQSLMEKHPNNWASEGSLFAIEDSGRVIARQKPVKATKDSSKASDQTNKPPDSPNQAGSDHPSKIYDTADVGLKAIGNPQLSTYAQALALTVDPDVRAQLKQQATELHKKTIAASDFPSHESQQAMNDHAGTFNVAEIANAQSKQRFISADQFIAELQSDPNRIIVADGDPEHAALLLAQINGKAKDVQNKPKLQGHISEPENPWQAFTDLPPDQRKEVIRILNNASQDTIDSIKQQGDDVLHGKPVVDFILSIDRAVRAIGTGTWKENMDKVCQDLQTIATGQPVGQQESIEKIAALGAGGLVKGIQGVDQAGRHAHPRAFVQDTHATAEAMRQGIGTAADYYGKKIQNNDLGSIPGDIADATNYAKDQTAAAINEFPNKDVSEQASVLGAGITVIFFIAATREFVDKTALSKTLGIGVDDLANMSDEQLEARGIRRLPAHENIDWSQRGVNTHESVVRKLDGYLLNPAHDEGGPKARWLKSALGFDRQNADQLAKQLVFNESKAVAKELTEFGQKYEQVTDLVGTNGRTIPTPVIWIKNPDNVTRLITVIPVDR